jgi:polyhydroxybutyrate depolymerase
MLHQHGYDGENVKFLSQFDLVADGYGFLVVYPNASSDWAYGCGCTEADTTGVDDVQFVADMIDALDTDYGVNRDSVFVAGFAEGALMAHRLVCEATSRFKGLATVAATMSVPAAAACTPSGPIPVLMINGTDDADFPFDGALDRGPESLLAADTSLQFWATGNGCGERQPSVYFGTDNYFQFDVYREAFEGCPANGEAIMLRMDGAEHGWPRVDFSASYEIGRFFVGACCGEPAEAYLP